MYRASESRDNRFAERDTFTACVVWEVRWLLRNPARE